MSDSITKKRDQDPNMFLFWGCFIALITTAFGFITRMFLLDDPAIISTLGLDPAQVGAYKGIQVWPFALSIIIFSLIIDKVGYKFSMMFAFVCQFIWAVMGVFALATIESDPERAKLLIYWGGLILALGNGTVEAFINPVVATMFDKDKTKWLNILHAGWPGGLVIAGILTILMESMELEWKYKLATIAIPALVYFAMLIRVQFPKQERVAAGISYKEMLSEFGILGAAVVGFLVTLQLMDFFPDGNRLLFIGIGIAMVVSFGAYTKSLGRPLMFVLILIMMPLATTEIGTDGWISGIMANAVTFHAGWILVYTSFIMMVLRFFAGPIVHNLTALGLLILSCVLAIAGLWSLSIAEGVVIIFLAATLYALGKTFFWPTMLGIVSEQTPRGGALTLNAISGIGMLAVGTLGFPYIGALQADKEIQEVKPYIQNVQEKDILTEKSIYEIIKYKTLDMDKVEDLVIDKAPNADRVKLQEQIQKASDGSGQKALASMTRFPLIMLVCYILIWIYFKMKGGYKPVTLSDAH
ncbi:MAG: MFS transporter [Pirellulales bacterium]|nr:MFS transporter [Pirellulales bacterium]